MMDMEMNAGLDILEEMKTNEALAPYMIEYTKLFEALYNAHRIEKELMDKIHSLKEENFMNTHNIFELNQTIRRKDEEIEMLKQNVIRALKRADAAHTREQNAQDIIENLRLNVQQLSQEIAQKNRQLAAGEDTSIAKQKENLILEKERLISEVETLKERLKNMTLYTDELENRTSIATQKISELQENIDIQLSEISRERRGRLKAEEEILQLQDELTVKKADLESASTTINTMTTNITKLESSLKEQKASSEKMQKEINKLSVKKLNLETDLENANSQIDTLEKDVLEKEKKIKEQKQTKYKLKEDILKLRTERDAMAKRIQKYETDKSALEEEVKQLSTKSKNLAHQRISLQKQIAVKQQEMEILLRERNILARTKENLGDQIKRLNHEMLVCEYSRRKIEHELDSSIRDIQDVQLHLTVVEKERDKHNQVAQGLAREVEEYINEAKLKQIEISNYKKRLAEAEAKYRQQVNLYEMVRAERSACGKSLTEAQEEIQELRNKLKVLNHQIEQLKEDIAFKESQMIKEQFLRNKVEKEKEGLRVDLLSCRKDVSDLRRDIESLKQEEKSLRQVILRAETDIARHKKDIDNVMNERDILGTQLVRRNDELTLQYSRLKVLHGTLQRGEVQYNQRLEDIRLLKLEVKKLRTEKCLLLKNIENMSNLRKEVFHLNRDLTKERLKVMALEEEVQTPLNIHRWRKLEGTDPSTYDLVKKIQILQKRVLKMAEDAIDKEKKIKDTEKLYMNLREILSKQPGPQVTVALSKTQKALRERGQKMKCLLAELSMCEVQMGEYKIGMERMTIEMSNLKKKYFAEKKKRYEAKDLKIKSEPIFPCVDQKKCLGGGFNMVAGPTPRAYFVIDSACR
ncbi:Coiled-coil domain-containing protein [Apis cerana cerana]|uniref:Coiled-coil domain-containing protein n=1 Tax=Apis cerana cerana TaxID=94128 RepID=A0A2A3ECR8_APICC|nr:Coiled-coil domain-containing protein [Apis cerana cerana]